MNLALCGRDVAKLESVSAELKRLGILAEPVAGDLADQVAIEDLVERAGAVLGPLAILVNCGGTEVASAYTRLTDDELRRLL